MKIPAKLLQIQRLQNDVTAMLAFLYSPEGIQVFSDMAEDDFSIAWGELTAEEAHAFLFLLNVADQINAVAQYQPGTLSLMPQVAFKALSNASTKLSAYRELLRKIEQNQLSSLEAKIGAGEISISQGQGVSMPVDQLNKLLVNAA